MFSFKKSFVFLLLSQAALAGTGPASPTPCMHHLKTANVTHFSKAKFRFKKTLKIACRCTQGVDNSPASMKQLQELFQDQGYENVKINAGQSITQSKNSGDFNTFTDAAYLINLWDVDHIILFNPLPLKTLNNLKANIGKSSFRKKLLEQRKDLTKTNKKKLDKILKQLKKGQTWNPELNFFLPDTAENSVIGLVHPEKVFNQIIKSEKEKDNIEAIKE